MKTIAAMIAGLLLSAMTFVGGLVTALVFFNAGEEQHQAQSLDSALLWTSEPVTVNRDPDTFVRLPARRVAEQRQAVAPPEKIGTVETPVQSAVAETEPVAEDPGSLVDPTTTGAIDPSLARPESEPDLAREQSVAHVEWCSRRYRSYRAGDNSYQPYSGDRRPCHSPFSGTAATEMEAEYASGESEVESPQPEEFYGEERIVESASFDEDPDAYLSSDHIRACQQRYRSYRVEDTSYQPFGGGPRRQCE